MHVIQYAKDSAQRIEFLASPSHSLLVFIHGGAWRTNSPSDFHFLSERFPVALVGYRLTSTTIKHPLHTQDVAKAIVWILLAAFSNVELQGSEILRNKIDNIILVGHSAGATMAALVSLNEEFLMQALHDLAPGHNSNFFGKISGVVGIEGIYDIPLLSHTFPTYKDWFLADTFGAEFGHEIGYSGSWIDASPVKIKTKFLNAHFLVIHSINDELVDLEQSKNFVAHLRNLHYEVSFDITSVVGKHDDVLKEDNLFAIVDKWVKGINNC